MRSLFSVRYGEFNTEDFDEDIGEWDVGAVQDMAMMFYLCKEFNRDIRGWNVGNVVYLAHMFYGATSFQRHPENSPFDRADTGLSGLYRGFTVG
jgi:hypothetical protein